MKQGSVGRRSPSKPLPAEVASKVRQRLLDGAFRPGSRIKLEALAQQFSMSVTPVREALLLLSSEGLVELVPRRGFIVARLSRQDILDAFWVQAEIRGELAARATQRMGEEDLRELSEFLMSAKDFLQKQDSDGFDSTMLLFDRGVNQSAESPKLEWFLERSLCINPAEIPVFSGKWRLEMCLNPYEQLLDDFIARKPKRACDTLRRNTWETGVAFLRHLERVDFWT